MYLPDSRNAGCTVTTGVWFPLTGTVPKHRDRYVKEFAGRHNGRPFDTADQMGNMVLGGLGKRLRYNEPDRPEGDSVLQGHERQGLRTRCLGVKETPRRLSVSARGER